MHFYFINTTFYYVNDHQLLTRARFHNGALPLNPTGGLPSPILPVCGVQKIPCRLLNYGSFMW